MSGRGAIEAHQFPELKARGSSPLGRDIFIKIALINESAIF